METQAPPLRMGVFHALNQPALRSISPFQRFGNSCTIGLKVQISNPLTYLGFASVKPPFILALVLVFPWHLTAIGQSAPPYGWSNILPTLSQRCFPCHQAEKKRGGLALDTQEGLLAGGDSGHAISEIIKRLKRMPSEEGAMPPKGPRFSSKEIDDLSKSLATLRAGPKTDLFWSLAQPIRPSVPKGIGSEHPLDAFLHQKLSEKGLDYSLPADKRTQIRRLKFGLVGLPPTPEEISAFEGDTSPDAFARLVENYLASKAHGERWARHWLDVVRFAESNGFETNTARPTAWVYRDWVIDCINKDLPYDQFVIAQLAGEQVGHPEGTGFLVGGPWDAVKSPDESLTRQQRADELHDMVATTTSTFLGITGGCARCHSHKFDPVSHEDYHRIKAVFEGVISGERDLPPNVSKAKELIALNKRLVVLEDALNSQRVLARPGKTIWIFPAKSVTPTFEPLIPPLGIAAYSLGSGKGEGSYEGDLNHLPTLGTGYAYWSKVRDKIVAAYRPGVTGEFSLGYSWGAGWNTHTTQAKLLLDWDGDIQTTNDRRELGILNQQHLTDPNSLVLQKPLWSGLSRFGIVRLNKRSAILLQAGPDDSFTSADLLVLQQLAIESPPSNSRENRSIILRSPVQTGKNLEAFSPVLADRIRITINSTNGSEPCLDEVEAFGPIDPDVNLLHKNRGVLVKASGSFPPHPFHKLEQINDGHYGNEKSWIGDRVNGVWVEFQLPKPVPIHQIQWSRDRTNPPKFLDRVMTGYRIEAGVSPGIMAVIADSSDRAKPGSPDGPSLQFNPIKVDRNQVADRIREYQKIRSEVSSRGNSSRGYVGTFVQPGPTRLLFRGDPMEPRQEIAPGSFDRIGQPFQLLPNTSEANRRMALARWIASPKNPLTARVIVNRLWQFHFGTGIVATPSDFGKNGARPTHPELLDWLAMELIHPQFLLHGEVAKPWSLKHIQRLIVTSRAYNQSSQITATGLAADAQTRLLWRFPSRRLEAEGIRDSILFVSGNLRDEGGGPGFDLFEPNSNYVKVYRSKATFGPPEWRRMVYQSKPRMQLDDVFGVFDCPDAGQITPKRTLSTNPLQSLGLLNSGFLNDQARIFSDRLAKEADSPSTQVRRAFHLAYQREPDSGELASALVVYTTIGPAAFCRAILASNEFLHPD